MRAKIKTFYHKNNLDYITLTTEEDSLEKWEKLLGKELDVDLRIHRDKKSLGQNNYYWAICKALADRHRTTKEEVHDLMVETYGNFFYMAIPKSEVPKIARLFKMVKDRGDIVLTTESGNKVECKQMQCYKSTKEYNSEEFSILLQGAIDTAVNEGIDVEKLKELKEYKEWKHGE